VRVHILTHYFYLFIFQVSSSQNLFNDLPALLAPATTELHDKLDQYLSMDPEHVSGKSVFAWWYERRGVYPRLYRMALDYLTIPGEPDFISIAVLLCNVCLSNVC
jgi:hypothetical protein